MSTSSSISATTQGLPIPELMELIKHSFRECEEKMNLETNNLKLKVSLLEKNQGLVELEKSKIEEKLQRSETKCGDLKETVTKMIEEATAKDKLISELKEKISELKNKNMENERFLGVYHEKFKCLDTTLVKMNKEIDDLRPEKLASNQKMVDSRLKQFDVDRIVKAAPKVDDLRRKTLESGKKDSTAPKEAKDLLDPIDRALLNRLLDPHLTISVSVQKG